MRGCEISVPANCDTQRGAGIREGALSASLIPVNGAYAVTLCAAVQEGDAVRAAAYPDGDPVPFAGGRAAVPVDESTEAVTVYRTRGGVTDCRTFALACEFAQTEEQPAEEAQDEEQPVEEAKPKARRTRKKTAE